MRTQIRILAMIAVVSTTAPVLAQSDTDSAAITPPAARPVGAYDVLPEGEKRIVSAIYEAQLGSANDTGSGTLLTRDEIAALRQKTGWGNAYNQLYAKGMVTEKNLGQAISTYNHSIQANRHITVISTGGGEQLAFSKDRRDNPTAKPGAGNSATAKPAPSKPAGVTTATSGAAGTTTTGATMSWATPSSAGGAPRASGNSQAGGIVLK